MLTTVFNTVPSGRPGDVPGNRTHLPNVWPMLGQRRRRWANIGQTLGRCVVFAGVAPKIDSKYFAHFEIIKHKSSNQEAHKLKFYQVSNYWFLHWFIFINMSFAILSPMRYFLCTVYQQICKIERISTYIIHSQLCIWRDKLLHRK